MELNLFIYLYLRIPPGGGEAYFRSRCVYVARHRRSNVAVVVLVVSIKQNVMRLDVTLNHGHGRLCSQSHGKNLKGGPTTLP